MDKYTTIEDLKHLVQKFTQERDWDKFLFPKTISIYLSVEASELLEKFIFVDNNESKQCLIDKQKEIEEELADIAYWILQMCWIYKIDLATALDKKIKANAQKYPVEKAKGNTKKYNEL
jgi:NTP pyrophosphatase (non-canonical NTP hydrolase)